MEIKWTDTDPETGGRRYIAAEKFAGCWHFRWKRHRREDWQRGLQPTRAMWEHILASLHARYRRRQGVSDADIAYVETVLRTWQEPPTFADEDETARERPAS